MSKICFFLPQKKTRLEIVLISATNVPTSHQEHLDCCPDTVLKLCSLLQTRLWRWARRAAALSSLCPSDLLTRSDVKLSTWAECSAVGDDSVLSLSDLWGQFVLLRTLHVQFHFDWFGNLNDLWCNTQAGQEHAVINTTLLTEPDLIISLTPSYEFFFSVSVEVLNQEMSRTCSAHPEVNLVFDSLLQILFCKRCCVRFWRETSLNMCRVIIKTRSVLFCPVRFYSVLFCLVHSLQQFYML